MRKHHKMMKRGIKGERELELKELQELDQRSSEIDFVLEDSQETQTYFHKSQDSCYT